MKVLYIAGGSCKYGASRSMMALLLHLKDHYNVEPVLLTKKRNKLNEVCDNHGIENTSCWYADFMSSAPYSFYPLRILKRIIKSILYLWGCCVERRVLYCGIDFKQIDIVHTNQNRISIGAFISRKYDIPHIWHIREFGQEDYNLRFHNPHAIEFMNRSASRFVAISNAVRDSWIKKGIEKDKIVTVYNGIDREGFFCKQLTAGGMVKLVIVGHVQQAKGQLQLVEAVSMLPQTIKDRIQVDIIGDGYSDYIYKINKVIKKNRLENIHFLGYCDDIPRRLAEYDVGIMCSRAEGFGRVTLEYLLAGLYVIASNTGANPELITDRETGLLYEYGDPASLAACIQEVLEKRLFINNISYQNPFTMERCAKQIYEIYKEVTAR